MRSAAAADPRVKAVAGVAGGYNSPAAMARGMGAGPYRAALGGFLARYDEYLPAVAPGGGEAAMGGDEPTSSTAPGGPPPRTGGTRSPGDRCTP